MALFYSFFIFNGCWLPIYWFQPLSSFNFIARGLPGMPQALACSSSGWGPVVAVSGAAGGLCWRICAADTQRRTAWLCVPLAVHVAASLSGEKVLPRQCHTWDQKWAWGVTGLGFSQDGSGGRQITERRILTSWSKARALGLHVPTPAPSRTWDFRPDSVPWFPHL